jgi:hypothetical protein
MQGGGDPSGSLAGVLTVDQFNANATALTPQGASNFMKRQNMAVRVNSIQQARSLPPGTPILLPDGRIGEVPAR